MPSSLAPPTLSARFADAVSELAVPWRAEEAPDPALVVLNETLAHELGFDVDWLRSEEGVRFLLGQGPWSDRAVAQVYAGHQFGQFVPRLGDGRALLLGEVTDQTGRVRDLHLKGSGRTPLARGGDGRAVLGPMLREFVVSEAMHALGIPTTRSLAVLTTGRGVQRETVLPGAVLVRVAASHLRVGSFEFVRAAGDTELLRRLADHAIARLHPEAAEAEAPHAALFDRVAAVQAELVAQWMNVGFVHGVMNTDNMTISGETIDYGPCAFVDHVDPMIVFSSIDAQGRYAYANQPAAAAWNLARFGEAIIPLIHEDPASAIEIAERILGRFGERYDAARKAGLRAKLGLTGAPSGETVDLLVDEWLALLTDEHADGTTAFAALGRVTADDREPVLEAFVDRARADAWLDRWFAAAPDQDAARAHQPIAIPRNHLVEEAIEAAHAGDLRPFEKLLEAVTDPYAPRDDRYAQPAPDSFGAYTTYCGT